ncbi:MAG: hypothetical protein HUU37_07745 [Bdellovibrionales bacterium]|nr:hypothetical protein [Bdellovibrionales bacterium]
MKSVLILALILTGCGGFRAQRVDSEQVDEKAMEITDEWVDGDTIRVIDGTMTRIGEHNKFRKFLAARGGRPIKLFVGEIKNNTSEAYFPAHDMEEALLEKLSDDEAYTLLDAKQREALLKEITYQNDGMVDPAQAKKIGRQSGADAMLFGTVNMDPKTRDGKTVKTYSVNFRLTDLETGEELVRTREKINKFSEQSSSGW